MQVSKHWDHPKIQAERKKGIEIESIAHFLRIFRRRPKPDISKSQEELMNEIAGKIFNKLFKLKMEELIVLKKSLSRGGDMWPTIYGRVRMLVTEHVKDDFYDEEVKRQEESDEQFAKIMQPVMEKLTRDWKRRRPLKRTRILMDRNTLNSQADTCPWDQTEEEYPDPIGFKW